MKEETKHVTSDANKNWVMAMAPQYLYQIEASHLDSMTPFKGFPRSNGAVIRQGVGGVSSGKFIIQRLGPRENGIIYLSGITGS